MTRPHRLKRHGLGQVRGANHPAAKLTDADVRWLRRMAAGADVPRGWMAAFAKRRKVSTATISNAIGGVTWRDCPVPPVPATVFRYLPSEPRRPICPSCWHPKFYAVLNGKPCRDKFHTIDHRRRDT